MVERAGAKCWQVAWPWPAWPRQGLRGAGRGGVVLLSVAVGGPITKLIDTYAADFEKENPNIKVRPIYAGSYQETIVKALTATRSGTPPVTSVLLSTDMFTLIDEDAIVPFDDFIRTDADREWLKGFLSRLHGKQPDRRQDLGIPFQRSTWCSTGTREMFREAGLDPEKPPQNWGAGRNSHRS